MRGTFRPPPPKPLRAVESATPSSGYRRRRPRGPRAPLRGAVGGGRGIVRSRGRPRGCRGASPGDGCWPLGSWVSCSKAASQSVSSARNLSRITGAWTRARSRSLTIDSTTSVLVRTPGERQQAKGLQLAHRQRGDHHRIGHLAHDGIDVAQVERDEAGHAEPTAEGVEELFGDRVQRQERVGFEDHLGPRPRCVIGHGRTLGVRLSGEVAVRSADGSSADANRPDTELGQLEDPAQPGLGTDHDQLTVVGAHPLEARRRACRDRSNPTKSAAVRSTAMRRLRSTAAGGRAGARPARTPCRDRR